VSGFDTTRWSVILRAGGSGNDARDALGVLCRRYRPPVLAYLKRRIRSEAEAEDLAQAFFERVLEHRLYDRADPGRGRFRTFLLTALVNFLHDEHDRNTSLKRGDGAAHDSIEQDEPFREGVADTAGPVREFERNWALALLDAALERLREESERAGKRALFESLQPYVLEPAEHDDYQVLAARLGVKANTVAVGVYRLRQRLRYHVREELRETVQSGADLDLELSALREALGAAVGD